MEKYIGTKIIEAEPAYRIDGKVYALSAPVPRSMNREEGYKVRYSDGYESWSPKDVFEAAYLPVVINPELRTTAPSISQQMVDDFICETEVITMGDIATFFGKRRYYAFHAFAWREHGYLRTLTDYLHIFSVQHNHYELVRKAFPYFYLNRICFSVIFGDSKM